MLLCFGFIFLLQLVYDHIGLLLFFKCLKLNRVQALILSPTRELASQTEKVILAMGNFISIKVHACIGRKSVGDDIRKLELGHQVVSGTPGRVCDMIKRRTLKTTHIKLLIVVSLCFVIPNLTLLTLLSLSDVQNAYECC